MKNLFIIKAITEDKELSDEAFAVWCGLRNIMRQDITEYFVSFNMIAHSLFNRVAGRYEQDAIKKGYKELVDKGFIKELVEYSKSERVVDLSALYYKKGDGFFADLTMEEMHKIMNIEGRHSSYQLLRYFTAQVGSFNKSKDMAYYGGKIGGCSLDYFTELIPITKPTVVSFNQILEENELLFIIRHNDFFQGTNAYGNSELREIPNTYSRWEDQEQAKAYAENTHGYKYFVEQKGKRTDKANKRRSNGIKLNLFIKGLKEYDVDTIKELYAYAEEKNENMKAYYNSMIKNGYNPDEPEYIDMNIFDDYLLEIC